MYTGYGRHHEPVFTMLHPGGAESRALTSIAEWFADWYRALTPDRRGHGRTADADGPMTFDGVADDTIAFLEQQETGRSPLLGYSDGAVVALLVTLRRPDLVSHLVIAGDDDMPLEHLLSLYRALPADELAVVPHASHGVLVEKPELCAALIAEFLRADMPPTFAPVRRAPST